MTLPGDLFICRNAGNIVPPHSEKANAMSASIEYAVTALGVKHIVICGHSNCGAMKGALDLSALDALPQVKDWLGICCDAVDAVKARHSGAGIEHLDEVIEENINLQIKNLMSHPAVADKVNAGEVTIHGWVYDIESGAIKCKGDSGFESFEKHYADIIAELG
jgi:carbonic anhydrase